MTVAKPKPCPDCGAQVSIYSYRLYTAQEELGELVRNVRNSDRVNREGVENCRAYEIEPGRMPPNDWSKWVVEPYAKRKARRLAARTEPQCR